MKGNRADNESYCGENVELTLKNITEGYKRKTDGSDNIYIRVNFTDRRGYKVTLRFWNPGPNVRKRSIQAIHLGSLCSAIGLDFNDIPFSHDFETFVGRFIKFTKDRWGKMIYGKLTLDEEDWLIPGEGIAFSAEPNLRYTELDKSNITIDSMDSHKLAGDLP